MPAVVDPTEDVRRAYPRPMLVREKWVCLNGAWEFARNVSANALQPAKVEFDEHIDVPFAPESPLSGIHDEAFLPRCWYRRSFDRPKLSLTDRCILHFEAADYTANVWVNGQFIGSHEGGYTRFSFDITDQLLDSPQQLIAVRIDDDPQDLSKPRGKQDWKAQPHAIWYPRTTGLWQSVWMEIVPAVRISSIQWTPCVKDWCIGVETHLHGINATSADAGNLRLNIKLAIGERVLADDIYTVTDSIVSRTIQLSDPGIDDARSELLWSVDRPNLIDAQLTLLDENGDVLDRVSSYTAMRTAEILGERFVFNGRPLQLRMVLDQGYWQEGGLTAPDDDAYRTDIELVKRLGFNCVRKHQKIECERFLYWADRLGLMVWEELPSAYQFSSKSIERLARQWTEAIQRDRSHPCIIAWVPMNESWAVPDLPLQPQQRHAVDALYHLTKSLDPTRPVIGNDGWEMSQTDIIAIHDYDHDSSRIATRYDARKRAISEILATERPGGRLLLLEPDIWRGQPLMLTEFGGIALSDDPSVSWGYSRAASPDDLLHRYAMLMSVVRANPLFAGFCYTQLTDTYQETNGLLYMDRTSKADMDSIAILTRGPRDEAEHRAEARLISPPRPLRTLPEAVSAPSRRTVMDRGKR